MSLTFPLQALLQRHETYVSDSEADRAHMLLEIERLERSRQEMQTANARIVEENRTLLEQLEGLNNAVSASDDEIKALTHRLEQTQLEMRELAASAARAADLELQLNAMEAEQVELQQQLILTQDDEKSSVHRWRKAETRLRDLQDQLDRLERDARAEREEHVQIIERMERRRAVERELDGAAGRLKGAAAASAMDRNRSSAARTAPVVSKFVRDILQDNANLQMGIVELRELLESSNQEVENLREQIMHHHQPLNENDDNDGNNNNIESSRLDQELGAKEKEQRPVSQEFHFHHHYHSPSSSIGSKKEKQPIRRPKKRRPSLMPSGVHTPRSPMSSYHRAQPSSSSTTTIMSQTSVSIPQHQQRYSMHPSGISSLASSPISAYQPSSIFDIVDQRSEISRPSSPESTAALMSPKRPRRKNRISDASMRSFSMPAAPAGLSYAEFDPIDNYDKFDGFGDEPDVFRDDYEEQPQILSPKNNAAGEEMWLPPAIPEEQEESVDVNTATETENQYIPSETGDAPGPSIDTFEPIQFNLRKSASYESLLSVSGMDIHTLRDRPSQLLAGYQSRYFQRPPQRITAAGTEISSTPPVISTTNITADKASLVARDSRQSSQSLLASVAAKSIMQPSTEVDTDGAGLSKKASIGSKVGGWVMGKWGIAPVSSADVLHTDTESIMSSTTESSAATITTISSDRTHQMRKNKPTQIRNTAIRGFGINQKGPIPGFLLPTSLPASSVAVHVDASVLDRELLDESLRDLT
jgi:hypothetical protein